MKGKVRMKECNLSLGKIKECRGLDERAFNGGLIGLIQLEWKKSIFQQTISERVHSLTVG